MLDVHTSTQVAMRFKGSSSAVSSDFRFGKPLPGSAPTAHSAPRLLVVEDDARFAALLTEYLTGHGLSVDVEARGDRAVARIWKDDPALVVLDLVLPGINGFEICRRARERYTRGILMLTANRTDVDEVVGFELGADDYVVKPVEPRILLARIRGLLRRLEGYTAVLASPQSLSIGMLAMDRGRRDVLIDGRPVEVTGIEFDLLWLLARRAGDLVSREEMSLQARGIPYDGVDRGIDVHISRLRRKLESAGLRSTTLKSVRGFGYLLSRP